MAAHVDRVGHEPRPLAVGRAHPYLGAAGARREAAGGAGQAAHRARGDDLPVAQQHGARSRRRVDIDVEGHRRAGDQALAHRRRAPSVAGRLERHAAGRRQPGEHACRVVPGGDGGDHAARVAAASPRERRRRGVTTLAKARKPPRRRHVGDDRRRRTARARPTARARAWASWPPTPTTGRRAASRSHWSITNVRLVDQRRQRLDRTPGIGQQRPPAAASPRRATRCRRSATPGRRTARPSRASAGSACGDPGMGDEADAAESGDVLDHAARLARQRIRRRRQRRARGSGRPRSPISTASMTSTPSR